MANQPETPTYDVGVYQIETADPVQGGVGGVDNKALLNLANRTAYLKQHLDALEAGSFIPATWAPINSPAFTGSPTAPTAAAGDNTTKIATDQFVQTAIGGLVTVDVSGNVPVVLTQPQWGVAVIILTGVITGNINVIFPAKSARWIVVNTTTGAFSITCKTAAGTGLAVSQGKAATIYCDATNIKLAHSDYNNVALTGTPTAPTAAAGDSSNLLANTAFVMNALVSGLSARIANEFLATATSPTPNMYVNVDVGHVFKDGSLTEVAAQQTPIFVAPASNSRIDFIVVDRATGVISVVAGTSGAVPVAPAIPTGKNPIAQVLLTAGMSAITSSLITDKRDLGSMGLGLAAFAGLSSNVVSSGGNLDLSNTGVPAGSAGSSASVPVISVDAKGRLTGVVDTPIRAASTAVTGIVKLSSDAAAQAKSDSAAALVASNLAALGASTSFAGLVQLATSTEVDTGIDTAKAVTSGALSASKRVIKALLSFDGTASVPSLSQSMNVSSVTKEGTGKYTVNWTNPFATTNYILGGSTGTKNGVTEPGSPAGGDNGVYFGAASAVGVRSTTQAKFYTQGSNSNNFEDASCVNVWAMGL